MVLKNYSFTYSEEKMVHWKIPINFLLRSKFLFLFFSFLSSHYTMTFNQLRKASRVLDVGCGLGFSMKCLQALGLQAKVTGVDTCRTYLRRLKHHEIYDSLIRASAKFLPFREKMFDALIFLQVLEHMTKKDGLNILKEMPRVADTIILTTPVGFIEAEVDFGNPFQTHRSGWFPKELRKLGYTVKGYGWLKIRAVKHLPLILLFFLVMLNIIVTPILRCAPRFAHHMYAEHSSIVELRKS